MNPLMGKVDKVVTKENNHLITINTGKGSYQAIIQEKVKIGDIINPKHASIKGNIFLFSDYVIIENRHTDHMEIRCFICGYIMDISSYKTILLNAKGIEKFQKPDGSCISQFTSKDDIVEACRICSELYGTKNEKGNLLDESKLHGEIKNGKAYPGSTDLNNYRAQNEAVLLMDDRNIVEKKQTTEEESFQFKEE